VSHFHRKPILVPIDFSTPSLHAVRIAKTIAEDDADITVVFVGHDYDAPAHIWGADDPPEHDRERQQIRLQMWANDNDLGEVKLQVRTGDPGTEVCKLAEEIGCQLIIVPSHGRHGVQRVLLGSVAERIIRHCDCSVLVLRRGEDSGSSLTLPDHWCPKKRIVVPVDFSSSTDATLDVALELVDDRPNIDVINVINVIPSFEDAVLIGSIVVSDADRRANRQESLERYLVEHSYSGMRAHTITGNPGTEIAKYADHVNADLVVMPSHGYHGLHRMVLGSTTERVIRHCNSPVLVLRRQDAE
jgi:nucleotide-binding universal stress UspA family protein